MLSAHDVALPRFEMPPPKLAELSGTVLPTSTSVPPLLMPPPEPSYVDPVIRHDAVGQRAVRPAVADPAAAETALVSDDDAIA